MPPASHAAEIATIVFAVVMLPIAGSIFQTVCNMCGADPPTFRRGVLITVLVGAAAFFTFDGISYGIALASRDTLNLNLPPGYHYGSWLREPLYLKWQVLGMLPLLRWLPVLFAFCLAATLYVFILTEPFRICVAILAGQEDAQALGRLGGAGGSLGEIQVDHGIDELGEHLGHLGHELA